MRFIRAVVSGELKVSNRKKADIEADLQARGFDRLAPKGKVRHKGLGRQHPHLLTDVIHCY